jgi:hypothetical protein
MVGLALDLAGETQVSSDNQFMLRHHFELEADAAACNWLASRPSARTRVIAYEVHRCCGGGKICQVKVRDLSAKEDTNNYATGILADGSQFLIDQRAAARLPSQFRLTVRGFGRFKHLDLDLDGEQWGALLYD